MECVRLRVKDVDFALRQIIVRDAKGRKDRLTVLPDCLTESLQRHLRRVRMLHQPHLAEGHGSVYLPFALEKKYTSAGRQWMWQYVFPAERLSTDPRSGVKRRHHADPRSLQQAVKKAARATSSPCDSASAARRPIRSPRR